MTNTNIILCGFMGCGKTTVGRLLAEKTGRQFVDMDNYIETRQQMTVSRIFETFGEPHFRELETEAAEELAKESNLVIAAGGGTLTVPRNVEILKATGIILMLDTPLSVIQKRLESDTTRPLLQKPNRGAVMEELYNKRLSAYKNAADIVVPADASPQKITATILEQLSTR